MPQYRIGQAARLLAVSDDTVRRRVAAGGLPAAADGAQRQVVPERALAAFAATHHAVVPDPWAGGLLGRQPAGRTGHRDHLSPVMVQVELQRGSHRVVALIGSAEAGELGLASGVVAVVVASATDVIVETPGGSS